MVRQLRSFALPFGALIVIPFLLVFDFHRPSLRLFLPLPVAQAAAGTVLCLAGLLLLVSTISLFARHGRGTLAPWDPTSRLVIRGPYARTRNPMISGVASVLLGEAALCGSLSLLAWLVIFVAANTLYFKLFEEPGLVKRFGKAYEEYRRNVPMWIPRVRPWRPPGDKP